MKGKKGGRQKKRWEDNIKEWTGMDFPSAAGELKTGQVGKGLLPIHLWCPDDLPMLDKVGKKAGNTHISQDGGKYW